MLKKQFYWGPNGLVLMTRFDWAKQQTCYEFILRCYDDEKKIRLKQLYRRIAKHNKLTLRDIVELTRESVDLPLIEHSPSREKVKQWLRATNQC